MQACLCKPSKTARDKMMAAAAQKDGGQQREATATMSEEEEGAFQADFGALPTSDSAADEAEEQPETSGEGAVTTENEPKNDAGENEEDEAVVVNTLAHKVERMDVADNKGSEEKELVEETWGGTEEPAGDTEEEEKEKDSNDSSPEANKPDEDFEAFTEAFASPEPPTEPADAAEDSSAAASTAEPTSNGGGGADPTATSTSTSLLPLTNTARTASLSKLRAYEAARRTAYKAKLASSSLYWRSFRELLHTSIEETERAEQIFKGSAESNTAYAISLRAAANDTLDEQGRPVVDPKKRKKLLESREKRRAAASASGPGGSASAIINAAEDAKVAKSKLYVSEKSFDKQADKGNGILDALIESQGIMADRFAEYAKYVYDEAVPEIVEIRQALVSEVTMMERLGDAIQEELDAAEKEVHDAWKSYYMSAEKSLSFANVKDVRRGAATAEDVDFVDNCSDVWVQEMRYRMSVAFLSTAWDKSSKELASLFGTLKSTECSRRFRLRELLIAFLNRQERLWLSLPSILTPVMKDLVDKPLDRESIESEVQTSIRVRAQGLQREEAKAKKLTNQVDDAGPGLKGIDPSKGNYNLTSPLVSDLLVKANVIEKKSSGMMSSWKTTLAIVTADSFLHLFEIPSSAKVSNGSAPEVAFHALVPAVEVPNEETAKANLVGRLLKEWFKMLHPAASLALPNCTIAFKDEDDTCVFEITEKVPNTGATSMLKGKTTTRKVSLRTLSNDETKEWIAAMKANK